MCILYLQNHINKCIYLSKPENVRLTRKCPVFSLDITGSITVLLVSTHAALAISLSKQGGFPFLCNSAHGLRFPRTFPVTQTFPVSKFTDGMEPILFVWTNN